MDNIYNNSQIEKILQIAARLPTMGINYVAAETGINLNTLYRQTSEEGHISAKNADIILNWLRDCRPDALEAAVILYERGVQNDRKRNT